MDSSFLSLAIRRIHGMMPQAPFLRKTTIRNIYILYNEINFNGGILLC